MTARATWNTKSHRDSPRSRQTAQTELTVLYEQFDPITGALIETALSQKMDEHQPANTTSNHPPNTYATQPANATANTETAAAFIKQRK